VMYTQEFYRKLLVMNNEYLQLAEEILKIRQNKLLSKYLKETSQYMTLNYHTGEIEFRENKELRPNYNKDKGWGNLVEPITPQHPVQHQNLSLLDE